MCPRFSLLQRGRAQVCPAPLGHPQGHACYPESGTRMGFLWMPRGSGQQKADQKGSICLLRAISEARGPVSSQRPGWGPAGSSAPCPTTPATLRADAPMPSPSRTRDSKSLHFNLPTRHSGGRTSVLSSLFLYSLVSRMSRLCLMLRVKGHCSQIGSGFIWLRGTV